MWLQLILYKVKSIIGGFGISSISNSILIKLSLEKRNYNSWSSFFNIHLGNLSLKKHIEQSSMGVSISYPEWCKLDDLIKMYSCILSESLQNQVVTTWGNAKGLWDHKQGLFHDNKDARVINHNNEIYQA